MTNENPNSLTPEQAQQVMPLVGINVVNNQVQVNFKDGTTDYEVLGLLEIAKQLVISRYKAV